MDIWSRRHPLHHIVCIEDETRLEFLERRHLITEPEFAAYRLVYTGGLHDVWCDGERHVWRQTFQTQHLFRRGRCDCTRYRTK